MNGPKARMNYTLVKRNHTLQPTLLPKVRLKYHMFSLPIISSLVTQILLIVPLVSFISLSLSIYIHLFLCSYLPVIIFLFLFLIFPLYIHILSLLYILTAAVASKLLQRFQLPQGQESTTQANIARVVVAIPSLQRLQFTKKLERLRGPPVSVINEIDETSPPLSFKFVNESIIGKDVEKVDEGFMSGCDCRAENGRSCGCEYRTCHCLQQSDKDEFGNVHFPYAASQRNRGCLRQVYLDSRNHIYECNGKCNCRANCKNKLVQNGRQVPLEIFKTADRGWGKYYRFVHPTQGRANQSRHVIGLRCPQALRKGQFVDTYRGEIITNEEADQRSQDRNIDQENYLMDLDKFNVDEMISKAQMKEELSPVEFKKIKAKVKQGEHKVSKDKDGTPLWLNPNYQAPYVCDGMEVGGPTRFMNHSCDPNCRIFTVSYNHADQRIYEIAFFAIEDIPSATELTFDYKDENDRGIITDEMADVVERDKGYRPAKCLCGSEHCRRYFFT